MFLIVLMLEGSEMDFSAPPPATTTADALGAMFISKPNRIHMPVVLRPESKLFSFNLYGKENFFHGNSKKGLSRTLANIFKGQIFRAEESPFKAGRKWEKGVRKTKAIRKKFSRDASSLLPFN